MGRPNTGIARSLAGAFAIAWLAHSAIADQVNGITVVASRVGKDYVHDKAPDGTLAPEGYAFGEGGNMGSAISDLSFFKMGFMDVARIIAAPLAERKYVASHDPNKTKLLIMVYWGTTQVPPAAESDPLYHNFRNAIDQYNILMADGAVDAANSVYYTGLVALNSENHQRDLIDARNAALLGYNGEDYDNVTTDYSHFLSHTALGAKYRDETVEIEENRYYVILMAYDFQLLWKKKKHKLLWETRFSLGERGNSFDKALPAMAESASKFFGMPSKGILRDRIGDGRVELGDPTVIEFLTGSRKQP